MQNAKLNAKCRMQNAKCKIKCKIQNAKCKIIFCALVIKQSLDCSAIQCHLIGTTFRKIKNFCRQYRKYRR